MNVYEVRAKKDEEIYRIEMAGRFLEEAIERYNFWAEPHSKLCTDMGIIEARIGHSIANDYCEVENVMREILKNKQDLHELAEREKIWEFGYGLPRLAGLYMRKQKIKNTSNKKFRGATLPLPRTCQNLMASVKFLLSF